MLFAAFINSNIINSAVVAYVHYLCINLCFGALLFERLRLKVDLNRQEAIALILADIIYGLAGVMLKLIENVH